MPRHILTWIIVWIFSGSPIYVLIPSLVQAAQPSNGTLSCVSGTTPTTDTTPEPNLAAGDENTPPVVIPGAEDSPTTFFSKASLSSKDLGLTAGLDLYGKYDSTTNGWNVCQENVQYLYAAVPFAPSTKTILDAFSIDRSRLTFKNPRDEWALTGEPCRKYLSDGTCDETLGPDGKTPLYYDDSYWPNGHWDAPKADARILTTLVYLVTPTSEGGAGHEHITVGEIIQDSPKNKEFQSASNSATTANKAADQTVSAHYYDQNNPEHPSVIAQSLEITEIDTVRVTTEIIAKHHSDDIGLFGILGGPKLTKAKKTYQYKSFPLKVAWQTDGGIAKDPPPNITDLYSGSLGNFSNSLGGLLDSLDLDISIDPSSLNLTSLGDAAKYVGDSLLQNLLQGGSLKGWDLPSTLDSFGRAYLGQQLGLPRGALSEGNTVDEVVRNVGRVIAEQNLQLPAGSLKGSSSEDIYRNLGARHLEKDVFNISEGTLSHSITNRDQFLRRLGAGKMEQVFGLKAGSAQDTDLNGLKKINSKAQTLLTDQSASSADDDLALTYSKTPFTDAYNLSDSSFNQPTQRLLHGQLSLNDFELLAGIRVWDSGIGQYSAATVDGGNQDTAKNTSSSGCTGQSGQGSCIASLTGNSFAPFFLDQLGVDVGKLTPSVSVLNYFSRGATSVDLRTPVDDAVNQAINSPKGKQLIATGSYTTDTLKTLVSRLTTLTRNTSNQAAMTADQKVAKAPDELKVSAYWRESLQTALGAANAQLDRPTSDETYRASDDTIEAASLLKQGLAMVNSDTDGWTDALAAHGQSGQTAALNFPGIMPTFDSNGVPTGKMLTAADPLNQLVNGDLSSLAVLGKLQLAKQVTDNPSSRYTLASQLTTDLSTSFNKFEAVLHPIADSSKLVGNGLESDDFAKIFQKNLSPEVFYRVGQQALLATAWDKANLSGNQQIKQVTSTINQIAGTATTIAANITFYTSRFETLQSEAASIGNGSNGVSADVKSALKDIASHKNVSLYDSIRRESSDLQTLFKQAASQEKGIQQEVASAQHTVDEIIAGHELSFGQGSNGDSSGQSAAGCWSKDLLRSSLLHGGNHFQDVASQVGACQVENSLSLPTGSVSNWYTQGKQSGQYTLDDFETSIGRADYGQGSFPNLTQAKERGQKVLEGRGISTLLASIPGIAGQAAQFGITGTTIMEMLQGNSSSTSKQIGEAVMDGKLHWKKGTSQALIDPVCHTDGTPCSNKERDNARLNAAAQMGMQELGINLGLPSTLDLTGSGTFSTIYGRASLSEGLGLSSNSFTGSFANLLDKNTPLVVLTSFGLTDTLTGQALATALQALQSKNTPSAEDLSHIKQVAKALDTDRSLLLGQATDPTSIASQLLSNFNSLPSSIVGNQPSQTALQQQLMAEIAPLQQKLDNLDLEHNVAAGTFKSYLTGKIRAEAINGIVGNKEAGHKLTNAAIEAALNATNNTFLQNAITGFRTFGKKAGCDEGDSLGNYLVGGGANCSLKALANIDFKSLFNGVDTQNGALRAGLYDQLLGRSFGASIESKLSLTPGTVRNLIVNPRQAKEIAISEGLNAVADQLFGTSNADATDAQKTRQGMHDAFLAGFYDVGQNRYSTHFDSNRSLTLFSETLNSSLNDGLKGFASQKLGLTMTGNDLNSILSGNTDTLLYLGAQRFETSLNTSLLGTNDPRAAKFVLNFADLRTSISGGVAPPDAFNQNLYGKAADEERHLFLTNPNYCNDPKDSTLCTNLGKSLDNPSADLDKQIVNGTDRNTSQNLIAMRDAGLDASIPASAQTIATRKSDAQKRLQYGMYDIAAFKLDHNIPPGFSQAMISGNSAQRSDMLGQYAFSALLGKDPELAKYIIPADLPGISHFVQSGFKDSTDLSIGAVNGVSSWATNQFDSKFGIKLPDKTMLGVIGWASTGFDRKQFDSGTIKSGPLACSDPKTCKFGKIVPVGNIIKEWGEEKLFTWGDKVLGFKAGDTFKIYEAGKKVYAAQQAISAAHVANTVAHAASVANKSSEILSKAASNATDAVQAARVANAEAIATVVLIVVEIVFAKQIAEAETQLGLVPGTGGMALGLIATAIIHSILPFAPAVAPLAIAVFIAVELFGVYKTVIITTATADGYYPIKGNFGDKGLIDSKNAQTYQYPSPNYQIGEFNPNDTTSYHDGLKKAAQAKVQGILSDILLMPERWGSKSGINPSQLETSQIFTARAEDVSSLDYLISRPSPRDTPAGFGYGPLSERCDTNALKQDPSTKQWSCPPNGNRFGVFPSDLFFDRVHLRW